MSLKRLAIALAAVAVTALVVVGLLQAKGTTSTAPSPLTLAQMKTSLAGSPAPLAALHAQADELLDGGLPSVRARLHELAGMPIVINKWASWCGPCRAEFGVFQRVSVTQGHRVAFIGIDSGDTNRSDAVAFLHTFPISYPTYYDQSGQAGLAITDSSFTPVTVFYNRSGGVFIHQGQYPSVAKLEQDIRLYALEG
jgi:cytochrome c biogenesis protein CcmG/thiol:disulfide interchange protein DsbE